MSLQAYQKAAEQAEAPRQVEYRLFGLVTRALMEADAAGPKDFSKRIRALHWNRRLWSTLADDCAAEGNALPPEARAQIISLALWVNRHTSAVMQSNEAIQPLIDVNRSIMQGLNS
ncbi:MAG TPA: flagellar biosynthesis regulator FlaF [Caulobacteraceae bacterium]|nr:flagellar biosynthesis regulator FlaF [Caulobacteraceae bacterium]